MPAGRRRRRKLTRVQIALLRRTPRKRERFIAEYEFPSHISARVRKGLPQARESEWPLVELGLREWFVCCAWRRVAVLGMPSRGDVNANGQCPRRDGGALTASTK